MVSNPFQTWSIPKQCIRGKGWELRKYLLSESVVHLEHFGPVDESRILQWLGGAERNVSCREIVADFANIKFVLQCHLDFEPSKGHGARTSYVGIDPGDSGDQEVRACEIEDVAEEEC